MPILSRGIRAIFGGTARGFRSLVPGDRNGLNPAGGAAPKSAGIITTWKRPTDGGSGSSDASPITGGSCTERCREGSELIASANFRMHHEPPSPPDEKAVSPHVAEGPKNRRENRESRQKIGGHKILFRDSSCESRNLIALADSDPASRTPDFAEFPQFRRGASPRNGMQPDVKLSCRHLPSGPFRPAGR